jgi:ATP phosphoribosyltransferase
VKSRKKAEPPIEALREEGVLTLALPAGRIREEAMAIFARAGIDLSPAEKARAGRKLVIPIESARMRVLIVRDTDVPAYVEHGAADVGIAGRDVLDEQDRDLYEPLDLGIARCRMVVAEPEDRPVDEGAHIHLRYATKFPEITRRHLQARGTVADPAPAPPARGGDHLRDQRPPVRGPRRRQADGRPDRRSGAPPDQGRRRRQMNVCPLRAARRG